MNSFFIKTKEDLKILFLNTSAKLGLSEAAVEKDYWMSFVLDYLFHVSQWKNAFTLKGGTSLSKCYKLIERFSENLDLILDWRVLGYEANEPWEKRSKAKQDKFNKEINAKTADFLQKKLLKDIERDFRKILKWEFQIRIDKENPQTILFEYPKVFKSSYLTQNIQLEIGCLAAWMPSRPTEIFPLIAEEYPHILKEKIIIRSIISERTFWEKATILHHEAHRPQCSPMPRRYARHYYDLYNMAISPIKETAIRNIKLLKEVVDLKKRFYPRTWAKYGDILQGQIRLLPDEYRFNEIKKDYGAMQEMIYGDYPTFTKMMKILKELEKEINQAIVFEK
ncbi:MAG: nucleotidyl transferase AbiEii/AbiGii toxin family protein [Bacilli bacterium]